MNNQKSIAVLPFHNTSNDLENRYFADGISEEIISALSKIKGLKVTARTSSFSYRDTDLDIRHIGNELGVSTILEGSVRKSEKRIRIAAQLIRTDTGFQIWSGRFDRELTDVFELQDEVSLLIADQIRENFGHLTIQDQLVTTRTDTSQAYSSYLKGRYYQLQWTEESIQKAQEAYKESIAADASYPMPYLGLSQCLTHLAAFQNYDRLKCLYLAYHHIEQLGSEHEHLAEYHYTKGIYHQLGNWEFEKAHTHLSKALSINPNYSEALEAKADLFITVGQFDSAKQCIKQAISLNPNALNHHFIHALLYYYQQDFLSCIKHLELALNIDTSWQMALQLKALSELSLAKNAAFFESISQLDENAQNGMKALQLVRLGEEVDVNSFSEDTLFFPVKLAILVCLNKTEEALEYLKEAISNRSGQYLGFAYDPFLTPLKSEAQFVRYANHFHPNGFQLNASTNQTKDEQVLSTAEIKLVSEELHKLMHEEKVFLNAQLSLRDVAESLEIHPNKLSWLINKELGKGFNEYVNSFRLEEFKRLSLDDSFKHLTLLGLAFESGFNSKSVFNEYFKKSTGTTPKKWILAASKK